MVERTGKETETASLVIDGIGQLYGDLAALNGVSLDVCKGEIVCLLGHSGCGKTTLLRVIAGVERPTSGRILLDGREVAGPTIYVPPEERGVGLMFQDYALFPHLTIGENVMFGLRGKPRGEARKIARDMLGRVNLERYFDDYPHMLSGGEQQRVALARALAPSPSILLMDEPFSNLDQRMRERIREETADLLREAGATAIVVTHDPVEAMQIATRIVLMRDGSIVQIGPGEELYRRPNSLFTARFFCDFEEVPGIARDGRLTTPLGTFAAPDCADGPALACIRPNAIGLLIEDAGGVQGRVESRTFLGEIDHVHLSVDGFDRIIHARLRTGYAMAPGDRVGVTIDPAGVLVFAVDR